MNVIYEVITLVSNTGTSAYTTTAATTTVAATTAANVVAVAANVVTKSFLFMLIFNKKLINIL